MSEPPEVVVVGAGFGGLAAGKTLARLPVHTTIVDTRNYHTFQPLLYQVATAVLDPEEVAHSVRGIFQGQPAVDFRLGTVARVDLDERVVLFDEGPPLPYDFLIVATGASTISSEVPGVEEHAFPLKTLGDAIRLRSHVLRQFERVDVDPSLMEDGALTFVIGGGGPTVGGIDRGDPGGFGARLVSTWRIPPWRVISM